MKRIFRMIVFSGLALFLTAFWNKGFIISNDPKKFLIATLAVALILYLIIPLSKIILLPLNLLTLGLMSILLYVGLFWLLENYFSLIKIRGWIFPGIRIIKLSIPRIPLEYVSNLLISSTSISVIINLLEGFL